MLLADELSLQLMHMNVMERADDMATMQQQTLLHKYAKLFEEPTRLPPKRLHDHHIPLKDDKRGS